MGAYPPLYDRVLGVAIEYGEASAALAKAPTAANRLRHERALHAVQQMARAVGDTERLVDLAAAAARAAAEAEAARLTSNVGRVAARRLASRGGV